MGIYLNPGNDGFVRAVRSEIYVDKTGLISCTNRYMNTEQQYICVSRPRRFGKSMAVQMLAAYYSCGCDSGELFSGLEIKNVPSFQEHLNRHQVLLLNMQQFLIGAKKQSVTEYLEQEVLEEVQGLCDRYGMDFTEAGSWYDGYQFTRFQHIYNPKSVVEAMHRHKFSNYWTSTETYDALKIYMDMDFDGLRADIVQMLGGEHIRVNTLSFQNDMCSLRTKDDVLTLLIHLGYLAYDSVKEEAFIPNREIIREFESAMNAGGWQEVMRILKASERLLEDTLCCDEECVAHGLDRAHTEAASILTYNDENSLSCAIGLAYYSARKDYKMIRELPTGRGFADVVFLPLPFCNKPALVVELKYDKSASTAIQQIKDRKYTQALEGYFGEVLLVEMNYDKGGKNKAHSCVIEKTEIY